MRFMFREAGALKYFTGLPLLALLFFCCAGAVFGNDTPLVYRLGADEAVDLAVRDNLGLENARIALETRRRGNNMAWNRFLPTITASGTFNRSNEGTPSLGMVMGPSGPTMGMVPSDPTWVFVGNISASINLSFAMIAEIQGTRFDYQAGLIAYDKARLQMERDIRKMYNQILLLEENAALLRETFTNTMRQAAIAEANFNAGLVPRLSMLQAQVAVENLRPTINELESNLSMLYSNFAMQLGLPMNTVFELEPIAKGDFTIPFDLSDLISRASREKPDIVELQMTIASLQNTRRATAHRLYTPNLNLSWNYQPMISDVSQDWFEPDNWTDRGGFSITLGMSLNTLFPFTNEGQALKNLDDSIRSLSINLAQAILGTELEIYSKINSLENTRSLMEVQTRAVELAQLTYNLTEEAYRAGLQDFQSVRSAALALEQARLQYVSQQFSFINDLIDLEYAIGVPFGTLSALGTGAAGTN